jgi:hypothetical protein
MISFLDWGVGGVVGSVVLLFMSYRATTRAFGWGPGDT